MENGNPQQPPTDYEALTSALGENPSTHWSYYAEGLNRLDALVVAWIARYAAHARSLVGAPSLSAALVAFADAAPAAYRKDTGLEPPGDLTARVFAAGSEVLRAAGHEPT